MDTTNRFKSIIDPIRDIASNWDIDIADSLNQYQLELEEIKISFDGGQTNVNFAEAALLIQGSTAVYSKKVEYLYQLVMKTLEYVSSSNSKNSDTKGNKATDSAIVTNDDIDNDDMLFGSDPSYLLLDDIVKEAEDEDIELKETRMDQKGDRNSVRN